MIPLLLVCWAAAPAWPVAERVPLPLGERYKEVTGTGLAFDHRGEKVALSLNSSPQDGLLQEVWDLRTLKAVPLAVAPKYGRIRQVLATRKGEWIALCDSAVIRCDRDGKEIGLFLLARHDSAGVAALDREEKNLLIYNHGLFMKYAIASGNRVSRVSYPVRNCEHLCPGPRFAVVREHQDVELRDAQTGKLLHSFEDHPGRVYAARLTADEKTLVTVWSRRRDAQSEVGVEVWDVATSRPTRRFTTTGSYPIVALSPAGDLIALGTNDSLRLFAIPSGEQLQVLGKQRPYRLEFSPDGRYLAALGPGLNVWRLRDRPH